MLHFHLVVENKHFMLNKKNLIEWKIKHQSYTGETREQTIERLQHGRSKFGICLKKMIAKNIL